MSLSDSRSIFRDSRNTERQETPTVAKLGNTATRPRAPRGSNAYRHLRYWRVGRKVGRTIYAMIREEPSDHDDLIGMMDTPKLAGRVVEAHNALLASELREAGRPDA